MIFHCHARPRALLISLFVLVGACAAFAAPARAATPAEPAGPLLLDTERHRVLAPGLYEIVYSARRHAVYTASAGHRQDPSSPSEILRLDPDTLAVQARIPLSEKGFGLALDDEADRLYVGHSLAPAVSVIDTRSDTRLATVRLARETRDAKGELRYPHHLRQLMLDRDRHRLYAPGLWFDDSALYVLDTRRLALERVIPGLGFVAAGIALDAPGNRLFVSNMAGQIHVFDTGTLARLRTMEIEADQPLNLVYDAATRRLLATDQGLPFIQSMAASMLPDFKSKGPGNRVIALDPDTGRLLASQPTDEGPIALLLDAPRQRLFVTHRAGSSVTVFDSRSGRRLDTIPLRGHPNSLAYDHAGATLYITLTAAENAPGETRESVVRVRWR